MTLVRQLDDHLIGSKFVGCLLVSGFVCCLNELVLKLYFKELNSSHSFSVHVFLSLSIFVSHLYILQSVIVSSLCHSSFLSLSLCLPPFFHILLSYSLILLSHFCCSILLQPSYSMQTHSSLSTYPHHYLSFLLFPSFNFTISQS